jgi:hypothetical protein
MADVDSTQEVRQAAVQVKRAADRLDDAIDRLEMSALGPEDPRISSPIDEDPEPPPDLDGPK